MTFAGSVLVATDLTDASDAALREADALASDRRSSLVVCHVLPEIVSVRLLFPQDAGVDAPLQVELEGKARDAVRARLAAVLGASSEAARIAIEFGTTHAGILEAAERHGAGLIALAPGATAMRVARSAGRPVLIARPSPAGGGVIGASDFSDPAFPAVQIAADEARRRKVPLRLVHCLDFDETAHLTAAGLPGMIPLPPLPQSTIDQLEQSAREQLAEALARTGGAGEAVLLRAQPARGIVELSKTSGASLVVVGTRGRTGFSRLALGSVAEDVIGHAECSVMVVPLHPAPAGHGGDQPA